MNKLLLPLLGTTLLCGCLHRMGDGSLEAGVNPTRFEYRCLPYDARNPIELQQTLNTYGTDGWEFVAFAPDGSKSIALCLKRER